MRPRVFPAEDLQHEVSGERRGEPASMRPRVFPAEDRTARNPLRSKEVHPWIARGRANREERAVADAMGLTMEGLQLSSCQGSTRLRALPGIHGSTGPLAPLRRHASDDYRLSAHRLELLPRLTTSGSTPSVTPIIDQHDVILRNDRSFHRDVQPVSA